MRTLMVHTGGIGDFILSLPALANLRSHAPVTLAGIRERLGLAVEAGLASDAYDLDSIDFGSVFTRPSERLKAFARPFERAVVWLRDEDGRIRTALHQCGIPDVIVHPGLPPGDWSRHASEYFLHCLGFAGPAESFRLTIAPSAVPHDVLIHPGSGGARKNWPLERFREVAQALVREGRTVEWVVGPAEEAIPLRPDEPTLPPASLVTLAQDLASARLYLGNDSGVTHLAAAVGCPTVAVFGPTDPRVWAPRGPHIHVVAAHPWPQTAEVLAAIRALCAD